MGWWERLPRDTRLELMRSTGLTRPDDIALRAMENPAYTGAFARLDVEVREYRDDYLGGPYPPEDFPAVEVLEADEEHFADLVVLSQPAAKTTAGAPDKDFSGQAIEDAVRMWKLRENHTPPTSQNAIAHKTGLSRPAVSRVVRLIDRGVLDWDEKHGNGWLGINKQFRATPDLISVRVLEKAHELAPLAR